MLDEQGSRVEDRLDDTRALLRAILSRLIPLTPW